MSKKEQQSHTAEFLSQDFLVYWYIGGRPAAVDSLGIELHGVEAAMDLMSGRKNRDRPEPVEHRCWRDRRPWDACSRCIRVR